MSKASELMEKQFIEVLCHSGHGVCRGTTTSTNKVCLVGIASPHQYSQNGHSWFPPIIMHNHPSNPMHYAICTMHAILLHTKVVPGKTYALQDIRSITICVMTISTVVYSY